VLFSIIVQPPAYALVNMQPTTTYRHKPLFRSYASADWICSGQQTNKRLTTWMQQSHSESKISSVNKKIPQIL